MVETDFTSSSLHSIYGINERLMGMEKYNHLKVISLDEWLQLERTYTGYHAVLRCDATGADFGLSISAFSYGLNSTGCAVFTEPEDACNTTMVSFRFYKLYTSKINSTVCHGQFAIVPRGNCSFSEKAYYAQTGRPDPYRAIVVYNEPGEPPLPMQGSRYADEVDIPVAMISYACMQNVMGRYPAEQGYVIALRSIPGYYDFIKYLAPFVAVVGFCFIVLSISLVIRVCRERRRIARKRLSRSNLRKLPTKKYRKGNSSNVFLLYISSSSDQPETCAVCLDDFADGEKLRILPCKHAYHCKCIDPWLTKNRKVCPICKRKVCSTGDSDSSDSDVERRRNAETATNTVVRPTTTRENAPLLRHEEEVGICFSIIPLLLLIRDNYCILHMASSDIHHGSLRVVHFMEDDEIGTNTQHLMLTYMSSVNVSANISASSSGRRETTQAMVHSDATDDARAAHDNSVVPATSTSPSGHNNDESSASGFSEAIRKKLRPLRPFVYGLVSRAMRTSQRSQPQNLEAILELLGRLLFSTNVPDSDGGNRRRFAAENDAFDDVEVNDRAPENTANVDEPKFWLVISEKNLAACRYPDSKVVPKLLVNLFPFLLPCEQSSLLSVSPMRNVDDEGGSGSALSVPVTENQQLQAPTEKRRRHPAASGKVTSVQLDLDVELPSDDEDDDSTDGYDADENDSVPKPESKTFGPDAAAAGGVAKGEHRAKRSAYSMPEQLSKKKKKKPGKNVGSQRTAESVADADSENTTNHETASNQRFRDDGIFRTSIDLEDNEDDVQENGNRKTISESNDGAIKEE
ncbi:unnamed protein product [Anisakis simplex]|uniref:Putative zinc finger protein (inferred by orthology to a S. mansoni protein) n=1 Tax=Anisakis simplex TaxID=6269 RepID=A0A0M3K6U2_ANISI|nr:unnamed protein product [Anisakis simplex]